MSIFSKLPARAAATVVRWLRHIPEPRVQVNQLCPSIRIPSSVSPSRVPLLPRPPVFVSSLFHLCSFAHVYRRTSPLPVDCPFSSTWCVSSPFFLFLSCPLLINHLLLSCPVPLASSRHPLHHHVPPLCVTAHLLRPHVPVSPSASSCPIPCVLMSLRLCVLAFDPDDFALGYSMTPSPAPQCPHPWFLDAPPAPRRLHPQLLNSRNHGSSTHPWLLDNPAPGSSMPVRLVPPHPRPGSSNA